MTDVFFSSLVLGIVAGLFAGLFGIGGGLIMVPVLVFLLTHQGIDHDLVMIVSVATSLASIVFTAIASLAAHHRLGSVLWDKVFRLAPGIMIGAGAGSVVADRLAAEWLRIVFIIYLLIVALQLAVEYQPKPGRFHTSRGLDFTVALVIGLLSAILGIGGGTLVVPYLVFFQIPMRNAVAVSSACGLPIAIAGSAGYALLGIDNPRLPDWSLGYIYLPAFWGIVLTSILTASVGAKLAYRLPARRLKRYFSLLLLVMAARMAWN